jgi:pyruvate dehydrogenase E2 component (dihydrolipoamide acetyltransferase)
MAVEIIVPRLGWSMEEGAFVAWLKQDGEPVHPGDPLFRIEGDKAVQDIESIDSGVLRIAANGPKPGDPIRVGVVLGHLVSSDELLPCLDAPGPPTAVPKPSASPAPPVATSSAAAPHAQMSAGGNLGQALAISPRARRVAAELGVEWSTLQGSGRNGRIREKDIQLAAGKLKPNFNPDRA